ncbi:hypothetical protein [Actinoalloteichus spitiensis]|uniref:hypothetical protein n=1 Tax=Actinoalloteichus spitiensis TaxID=252394 RepID=UPI0002F3FEB5|nr:hypothetical protein [Actinoalloteichus spitiensis]
MKIKHLFEWVSRFVVPVSRWPENVATIERAFGAGRIGNRRSAGAVWWTMSINGMERVCSWSRSAGG